MTHWKIQQRIREALTKATRRGTLRTIWTPRGRIAADSPTISKMALAITKIDAEAKAVTLEYATDAAHPVQDQWTRRWKGSTP